jgi:hypothetical protein
MQFYYLAVFFLIIIILLAFLLLAPFHLSLNIGKKGPLIDGSIKLAWLGRPLMKAEICPQSAGDLLASIWKEASGTKDRTIEVRKSVEEEMGREERSEIDNQKKGAVRPPSIQSLINAAPALAKILRDLLKSIHFKNISCRLCFGLDDPAQTAIISGYLWFLASALGLFSANIFIEPWFEGERLEGELVAEMKARLLWVVFAVVQVLRVREIRLLLRETLGWA